MRGGSRANSGPKKGAKYRTRAKREIAALKDLGADADSKDVIRRIMLHSDDEKTVLRAAEILLPYEHMKAGEGKKEQRARAAGEVARGSRFAVPAAPKLVVNNG